MTRNRKQVLLTQEFLISVYHILLNTSDPLGPVYGAHGKIVVTKVMNEERQCSLKLNYII